MLSDMTSCHVHTTKLALKSAQSKNAPDISGLNHIRDYCTDLAAAYLKDFNEGNHDRNGRISVSQWRRKRADSKNSRR